MSTADRNFTVKLTLEDANLVREALESYKETCHAASKVASGDGRTADAAFSEPAAKVLRIEALLRISF